MRNSKAKKTIGTIKRRFARKAAAVRVGARPARTRLAASARRPANDCPTCSQAEGCRAEIRSLAKKLAASYLSGEITWRETRRLIRGAAVR